MKPKNFTVGQTAYLLEAQQSRFKGTDRIRKVNVLKVGRVYVTIDDYGRGRRFGLLGGRDPYLHEVSPAAMAAKLFTTYDGAVDEIKRETLIRKHSSGKSTAHRSSPFATVRLPNLSKSTIYFSLTRRVSDE